MDMKQGIFITFEGTDGSGKTTQIELLKEYLTRRNYEFIVTREPGGTPIGEELRKIILNKEFHMMTPVTEAMLYAASRAQHVEEVIKPALKAGKIVLCDRYLDSSVAYQGFGRNLGNTVTMINEIAISGIMPDKTFLLQVNPDKGKNRIKRDLDRLEAESRSYHEAVFRGYDELSMKSPERIYKLDGSQSIEVIHAEIIKEMEKLILSNFIEKGAVT